MTTLLALTTFRGLIGRCDARCYEAQQPACTCICGGRNHGRGRQVAVAQTRDLAESWIAEAARREHCPVSILDWAPECQQASLWVEEPPTLKGGIYA